jgi:hypothetical protein
VIQNDLFMQQNVSTGINPVQFVIYSKGGVMPEQGLTSHWKILMQCRAKKINKTPVMMHNCLFIVQEKCVAEYVQQSEYE